MIDASETVATFKVNTNSGMIVSVFPPKNKDTINKYPVCEKTPNKNRNKTNPATAPYVGVSICFGRRSGKTGQDFLDIFTADDILTVARGFGSGDHVANCMYISNNSAGTIQSLINNIEEITTESVNAATESFKVAHRPINPITEGTNRGKNVYTRFKPYQKLATKTVIRDPKELFKLGEFVEVEPNALNHNHILDDLEANYNIVIPRKGR